MIWLEGLYSELLHCVFAVLVLSPLILGIWYAYSRMKVRSLFFYILVFVCIFPDSDI